MSEQDHDAAPRGTDARPPGLRAELAEVSVFVFQILPALVLSFFAGDEGGGVSYALGVGAIMARDLALVSLVVFFVWRNGEGARKLGWRAGHLLREALWGVLLFAPVAAGMAAIETLLHALGVPAEPGRPVPEILRPHGTAELVLATELVAVVAVAEETIFRGYLVLRFRRLSRSTALALVLSSVIFAFGHGYEGPIGVVTIGFMGLFLAIIRVWRGSLTAPIVIHFLQDILSIVILPILAARR